MLTEQLLNIKGITSVYDDTAYSWVDYEINIEQGTEWSVIQQIEMLDVEILEFGPPGSKTNTLLLEDA